MGWKFRWRRSSKIGPVRVTQTQSGTSFSVGIPGLRYTFRADGKRQITLGLPGSGLSMTNILGEQSDSSKAIQNPKPTAQIQKPKQQVQIQTTKPVQQIQKSQQQEKPWWIS